MSKKIKELTWNQIGKTAVTGLLKRLESAEKFVLAEAPEVFRQILLEDLLENIFTTVGFATASIFFAYETFRDKTGWADCTGEVVTSMCGTFFFFTTIITGVGLFYIFRNRLCPKIVLLEKLKELF